MNLNEMVRIVLVDNGLNETGRNTDGLSTYRGLAEEMLLRENIRVQSELQWGISRQVVKLTPDSTTKRIEVSNYVLSADLIEPRSVGWAIEKVGRKIIKTHPSDPMVDQGDQFDEAIIVEQQVVRDIECLQHNMQEYIAARTSLEMCLHRRDATLVQPLTVKRDSARRNALTEQRRQDDTNTVMSARSWNTSHQSWWRRYRRDV